MSAAEWLLCLVTSAPELTGKSFALSPAREGWAVGQSELAQDPENGWRTEGKGQKKGEEEQTPQDHVLAYPGHHLLQLVNTVIGKFLFTFILVLVIFVLLFWYFCLSLRGLGLREKGKCFISVFYLTGSRVPRFDPTAYIQDRQRRQKEADLKKLVSVKFPFKSLTIHWYLML